MNHDWLIFIMHEQLLPYFRLKYMVFKSRTIYCPLENSQSVHILFYTFFTKRQDSSQIRIDTWNFHIIKSSAGNKRSMGHIAHLSTSIYTVIHVSFQTWVNLLLYMTQDLMQFSIWYSVPLVQSMAFYSNTFLGTTDT